MVGPGAGQMRPGNVNQIIGGQMIGGPPMPGQMMRARMAGTTWGHTQEVTLQQRNPQMMPGGPSGMTGGSSEIPANSPVSERPPPPPFNTQPGPPQPPNNPQTDEERRQVVQYEAWLQQHDSEINQQLKYYETEIGKIRKQRKSLNTKKRTMEKNGNCLATQDQAELDRITSEAPGLQKNLENFRKLSRQHTITANEHRSRKVKALEAQGIPTEQAQSMVAGIGGMQHQQWHGAGPPGGMVHVQRAPGGPQVRPMMVGAGYPGQPGGPGMQQQMMMRMGGPGAPQGPQGMPQQQMRPMMVQAPGQVILQRPGGGGMRMMSPGPQPINSPGQSPHYMSGPQNSPLGHPSQSPNSFNITSPGQFNVTSPNSFSVTSPNPHNPNMNLQRPPSMTS